MNKKLTEKEIEKAGKMKKGTQPLTDEPFELNEDFFWMKTLRIIIIMRRKR